MSDRRRYSSSSRRHDLGRRKSDGRNGDVRPSSETGRSRASSYPEKVYDSDSTSVTYPSSISDGDSVAASSTRPHDRRDSSHSSRKRQTSRRRQPSSHHDHHHSRHNSYDEDETYRRRRSSRSSRHRERDRDRHRRHPKALMPSPAEDDEKAHNPMTAVAVRDEYPVQTVPPAYRRNDPSSDEEEVYDHRPRPVSRRGASRGFTPAHHQQQQQGANNNNNAEQGFLMAAVMVALSLVICCGEVEE